MRTSRKLSTRKEIVEGVCRAFATTALGIMLCLPSISQAAILNAPETFGDGGAPSENAWTFGAGGAVADAGEGGVGDHALQYTANTDRGFHLLHWADGATPNIAFVGGFTTAGVYALNFRARHSGQGDALALRATLFRRFAIGFDWITTIDTAVIAPTATSWQDYSLRLLPQDFIAGGDSGLSPTDLLDITEQLGLRHDPAGNGPLSSGQSRMTQTTTVFFDDIVLVGAPPTPPQGVPAPATLALFALGLLALRRCRA